VGDFDAEDLGIARKISGIVAVSEDDKRRNPSEEVEHRFAADIAQMHDALGTAGDEEIDGASRAVGATVGI
jgi:hypothetical protein